MLGDLMSFAVRSALAPVKAAAEIVDGLSEGEIRERAIAELGAEVVGGMALAELIDWYTQQESN